MKRVAVLQRRAQAKEEKEAAAVRRQRRHAAAEEEGEEEEEEGASTRTCRSPRRLSCTGAPDQTTRKKTRQGL